LNKCEHQSLCLEDESIEIGYRCICATDYTGQFCETFQDVRINILQDDPCSGNDCANNSTCQSSNEYTSGYKCICGYGFTGTYCNSLSSLSFVTNGSYVLMPDMQMSMDDSTTKFTFHLSTMQENGILLYWGSDPPRDQQRLLTVEFFAGHVKLRMGVASDEWETVYSPNPINDGRAHEVEIEVSSRQLSVVVDGGKKISRSTVTSYDETSSTLELGGVSAAVLHDSNRYWFYSNSTSFKGCIHSFLIDDVPHDFGLLADIRGNTSGVSAGCDVMRSCDLDCGVHGSCRYSGEDDQMYCDCRQGFAGELCALRLTEGMVNCPRSNLGYCVHGTCVRNSESQGSSGSRSVRTAVTVKFPFKCRCATGFAGARCDREDRCLNVNCGRGYCVNSAASQNGYRCNCPRHFTGDSCETRIQSCKGRRTKSFLTTTKSDTTTLTLIQCRSLREVTNTQCSAGKCSRSSRDANNSGGSGAVERCCRPLRQQRKRIRYRCDDGSSVTSVITRVRRCSCDHSSGSSGVSSC